MSKKTSAKKTQPSPKNTSSSSSLETYRSSPITPPQPLFAAIKPQTSKSSELHVHTVVFDSPIVDDTTRSQHNDRFKQPSATSYQTPHSKIPDVSLSYRDNNAPKRDNNSQVQFDSTSHLQELATELEQITTELEEIDAELSRIKSNSSQRPISPPSPKQKTTTLPTTQSTPSVTTIQTPTPPYRVRGLDGLRALACIIVLLYHFLPGSTSGGFLGVDVFFVLSGFLITGLLLKEHRKYGRINLVNFWIRRVRRLLPAVTLLVLTIVPVAHMINRDLLVGIGRQVFGVLTFSYNWMEIFAGSDYFDAQNPHLFTNVWSLGVEEQFYLLWPIIVTALIWLFTIKRHRLSAIVPFVFAVLSASWMALVIERTFTPETPNLTRAYMGTDTHAFGLMLGAALAFFLTRPLERSSREFKPWLITVRGLLGWVGIVGTITSFFVVHDNELKTYPYGILLCSLSVTLFLQATVDDIAGKPGPAQLLMKIVDVKPLAWIGERSYGIYLWHWPLLVIFQATLPLSPIWFSAVSVAILSVIIAGLSYHFMENPMRKYGIGKTLKFWFSPHPSKIVIARRIAFPVAVALIALPLTILVIADAPKETSVEKMLASVQQVYESDQGKVNEAVVDPNSASPQAKTKSNVNQDNAFKESQDATNNSTGSDTKNRNNKKSTAHKPTPFDLTPIEGKDVLVIGDSVTLGCKPFIEDILPGSVVDGEVSRSILKANGLIDNYKKTLGQRKYVVISLGTNSAVTMEQIDSIMANLDPSVKTVWVNAYGPSRLSWIKPTNDVLDKGQTKYPDRILVADWYGTIKGHEDLLAADWAHPAVEESQKMYANLIKETLNEWQEREVRSRVTDLISPIFNLHS